MVELRRAAVTSPRWTRRCPAALASGLLAGCPAGGVRDLVDPGAWQASADDPWPAHAPEPADCSPLAWGLELTEELEVLEVDTAACDYLVVGQGSLARVREGEHVSARVSFGALDAPQPAEAHVAVVLDGWAVLDERVAIPGLAGEIEVGASAPAGIDAGALVVFHLHNHGANTWNLEWIRAGEE